MDLGAPPNLPMDSSQRTSFISNTSEVILPRSILIPPCSALKAPISSSGRFDSMIDDVDKINTSMKRSTRQRRDSTCLSAATGMLHDNTGTPSHQQIPRSIVIFEKMPTLRNEKDYRYHDHDDDPHYATILVLEDFFDGIEDNVDVRMEVKEFEKALPTTGMHFPVRLEDAIDLGFTTGSGVRVG